MNSIPTIRVVEDDSNNKYWSLDNRRLWAFKAAGLKSIPVSIILPNEYYLRYELGDGSGVEDSIE